jgi:hypothetical protein
MRVTIRRATDWSANGSLDPPDLFVLDSRA